jgi:hypothetical protein
MSVVAQAGAWIASARIIPHPVSAIESSALAASLTPAGENAGNGPMIVTPVARIE